MDSIDEGQFAILKELATLLQGTLLPHTQKEAEQKLTVFKTSIATFPVQLLQLCNHGTLKQLGIPLVVDVPAALYLKNLVKGDWENMESNVLGQATRVALKSLIIDVLVLGSAAVRTQLIEVICCMALHDFPESWPDLIDKLLSKISADNFSVNLVILKACHYIFKRYRREMRSDELYTEINYVMSRFGPALLQLYRGLEGVLKASDSGDSGHIKLLLQNVTYANKIFYSLSFQDIPAHIEDNLGEFMRLLLAFFAFHSARPDLASSPDQAGILEKLASSAAKVFALYAEKYEEDFTMLPAVAEATWVTLTSRVSQLPKDDKLAFVCLDFLASIARQERHKVLFQPILQILCEQIIVPNLAIRDTDMEVFEDDPMEFIRRESDSSLEDSSSRSSVAIVLTRNLTEFFEQDMTRILFQAIQQQLQEYSHNPSANWRSKVLAIRLFSAIGARGHTELFGVTRVNSMLNVHDFFQQTIKPDLVDGSEQLAPLLKLEIMKFTLNYRSQLSKEELTVTLPRLMVHLQSKSYILHTFAALTIEKLLSLKRSGEPLFSSTDIRAMIDNLSFSIIALIFGHKTVDKMCENHFLTRTLMHVLDVAQPADIDRILSKFSDRLVWLFQEIGRNPVNPQFNHYYYECIVLCVSTASEQHRAQLELKLVPIIFGLLQADQTDFFPYAFQILTALVECHEALPEYAKSVLPLMGQPVLWSPASGSIPALVRFIQACANRDQDVIAAQTNGLMAIVRSLIFSRVNDSHGFALMNVFFRVLSEAELCKVARPLLLMVLNRVQVHKSPRFNLNFLVSLSYFVVESNLTPSTAANLLIEVLNQIQPRIYQMLFKSLFFDCASHLTDVNERKLVVVACSEILSCLCGLIKEQDPQFWFELLDMALLVVPDAAVEPSGSEHGDSPAGPVTFNRLVSVSRYKRFVRLISLPEASVYLLQHLKAILTALGVAPSVVSGLINARLSAPARAKLDLLCQRYGSPF